MYIGISKQMERLRRDSGAGLWAEPSFRIAIGNPIK
jgi:hypothetical protein